jgi:isoquinoline 1-oxidoreductase
MSRDDLGPTDERDNELIVDGPGCFPVGRRDFVKLTATGLLMVFAVDRVGAFQETERPQTGRQGYPADLNAYLHIGGDGRVTCFTGKIEMGQGPMTSLPQLLAEELDVPLDSVDIVLGDTDLCPWDMGTFGSLTVRQFGPVLRQAAAEARTVLLQMASERLQAPVEKLTVSRGVVKVEGGTASVSYAQLTGGKRIERTVQGKPVLKPVKAFSVVGRSPGVRRDALEKVTGKARYAGDIVPPGGALHARVLRPPAHGAVLASVDTSAASALPAARCCTATFPPAGA